MTTENEMMRPLFTVRQNELGDWIARERRSAVAHAFPTQKEAIHFALFAVGGGRAAALVTPPDAGSPGA